MDKFVKLGLVAVMLVAAGSAASGDLVFRMTYTEQDTSSSNPPNLEQQSDLWTLELIGSPTETVSIQSVRIYLTDQANGEGDIYGRKYFDTTGGDSSGFDPCGIFTPDSNLQGIVTGAAYSSTDDSSASVQYTNELTIDFGGHSFAGGDYYSFTADVDNTDAIVWGGTLAEIGAYVTIKYDGGQKLAYFEAAPGAPTAVAQATVAPLPGSLLLTGIGLGFMGVVRRFRKK